jgi:hypothetical protein
MAGLDPATQCARVRARKRFGAMCARCNESFAARTRGGWVAASRAAMVSGGYGTGFAKSENAATTFE